MLYSMEQATSVVYKDSSDSWKFFTVCNNVSNTILNALQLVE